MVSIDWTLATGVTTVVVLVIVPLYVYQLNRRNERVQMIRPVLLELRETTNSIQATKRSAPLQVHYSVAGLGTAYERIEKQGLDLLLAREARDVYDTLVTVRDKVKAAEEAANAATRGDAQGYWAKMADLFRKEDNFSQLTDKLGKQAESWLVSHT